MILKYCSNCFLQDPIPQYICLYYISSIINHRKKLFEKKNMNKRIIASQSVVVNYCLLCGDVVLGLHFVVMMPFLV